MQAGGICRKGNFKMAVKITGEYGDAYISNNVIAQVAGAVATKCYGVVGMASRSKKDGLVNLLRGDSMTKGIKIDAEDKGIIVEMNIIVEYGTNISTVCKSVVNRTKYTLEQNVGLKVNQVRVKVEGIRVDE